MVRLWSSLWSLWLPLLLLLLRLLRLDFRVISGSANPPPMLQVVDKGWKFQKDAALKGKEEANENLERGCVPAETAEVVSASGVGSDNVFVAGTRCRSLDTPSLEGTYGSTVPNFSDLMDI
jgi:hypothetical protein